MKKIQPFWNWFRKNEEALKHAIVLGINADALMGDFERKLGYISKRIGFFTLEPKVENGKIVLLFTCHGYRKLFPKMIALEELAPEMELFEVQSFIKPTENLDKMKLGTDASYGFDDCSFKISDLWFSLQSFDLKRKQVKITIFIPNYTELASYYDLHDEISLLLMGLIGEINYRKHLKSYELAELPTRTEGLIRLYELQEHIDYLYTINSRKRPRSI